MELLLLLSYCRRTTKHALGSSTGSNIVVVEVLYSSKFAWVCCCRCGNGVVVELVLLWNYACVCSCTCGIVVVVELLSVWNCRCGIVVGVELLV